MAEAGEYYRLFYDLMVMALRTDSTRVITCGIGSEGNTSGIPEIGILQTRHGLSHHNGDPEQLRRLTETDTFLVGQLSYFLDQLKEHKEGDTPLLDTTQVLWGSGMAYGHSHGNANLPLVLAGGGYRHPGHLAFDEKRNEPLANLFVTMLQRLGVETDAFSSSTGTLRGLDG
jgi:hypothetical protein